MKAATLEHTVRAFVRNPATFLALLRRLPTMARLFWRVFWDRRTGWLPRLLLLGTFAYVLSPIDLLPVAVFGPLGLLDDFTLLALGCRAFLRGVPDAVLNEHVATVGQSPPAPS